MGLSAVTHRASHTPHLTVTLTQSRGCICGRCFPSPWDGKAVLGGVALRTTVMWLHCRGLWTAAGVGPRFSLTYCPDIHGLVSPGPSYLPSLVFYRVCVSKDPGFSLSRLPGNC